MNNIENLKGIFREVAKEFENGTYDFTDNGKCIQCGACCSNLLPMTDKEIETIRKYIKKHNIKEHKHMLPLANPVIDNTCPFLNDKKTERCKIYEVRPAICKEFSCCPEKRKPLSNEYRVEARVVNVRAAFYGSIV